MWVGQRRRAGRQTYSKTALDWPRNETEATGAALPSDKRASVLAGPHSTDRRRRASRCCWLANRQWSWIDQRIGLGIAGALAGLAQYRVERFGKASATGEAAFGIAKNSVSESASVRAVPGGSAAR
jgi:hypothetical protein